MGDTPVEQRVEPKSSTDLPPIDESESFPVTSDVVEASNATQRSEVPTTSQVSSPHITPNTYSQQTAVTHHYPRRRHQPPERYRT